jgi:DNA polymerase
MSPARRSRTETTPPITPVAAFLPSERTLPALREAAARCEACDLFRAATQTVFGEGPEDAPVMLVGEQPGDREDREGRPFVGPAGRLLDEALALAEVPRPRVYVTNAVKHFKFEERGKRRLHQRPTTKEIRICSGWLFAEIEALKPQMIVCLGATAAQTFMGSSFRLTHHRGEVITSPWAPFWMATYHPSAILRMIEANVRAAAQEALVSDLRQISKHVSLDVRAAASW